MQARKRNHRSLWRPELKPFFQRDGVSLFHADSLQVLPAFQPDIAAAVITDPPYSSGGQTTGERARDPREKYCHNNNDCGRASFALRNMFARPTSST